ncbi:hypothetical protein ACSLNH_17000, partial [Comamonas kerstersii]|uniref:hypothetical protein n=1 Tax=Comamonas kerstersii TaxID=225992 RepID=UPI003EDF142D
VSEVCFIESAQMGKHFLLCFLNFSDLCGQPLHAVVQLLRVDVAALQDSAVVPSVPDMSS